MDANFKSAVTSAMTDNGIPVDLADSIFRGAALLDDKLPEGWDRKIDTDTLKVSDVTLCVLGQLAQAYNGKIEGFGFNSEASGFFNYATGFDTMVDFIDIDAEDCQDFGFDAPEHSYDNGNWTRAFEWLTLGWTILLKARLGQ